MTTVSLENHVLTSRDFQTTWLTKESTLSNTKQNVVATLPQKGGSSVYSTGFLPQLRRGAPQLRHRATYDKCILRLRKIP